MSVEPPTSAEALEIIERERRSVAAALVPGLALMHGAWGLAWTVAGALYYAYAVGALGGLATGLAALAVLVAASATSTVAARRGSRGVRSGSDRQAAMYGLSWPVGLGLAGVLAAGVADDGTVVAALVVSAAGLLCVGSGVVWTNWPQYVGGAVIMAVAALSVFVPAPTSILVLAVGGGGAWLAMAAWFRVAGSRR